MHDRLMRDVHEGDVVVITDALPNDPAPLEVGDRGKVRTVLNAGSQYPELEQLVVAWESGRTLMLVVGDPFEVVAEES